MSALGDADPCGKEVASTDWIDEVCPECSTTPRDDIPQAFGVNLTWPIGPGRRPKPSAQLTCQNVDPFLVFLKSFRKIQSHGKLPSLNLTAYEAATDSGDIRCPANEDKKEQRNTARKKQGLSSLSSLRHYKWPVICPAHTLTIKYWSTDLPAFPTFYYDTILNANEFSCPDARCSPVFMLEEEVAAVDLQLETWTTWTTGLSTWTTQVPGIFLSLLFCPSKPRKFSKICCFKSFTIKSWPGWWSKHGCFQLTSEVNNHPSLNFAALTVLKSGLMNPGVIILPTSTNSNTAVLGANHSELPYICRLILHLNICDHWMVSNSTTLNEAQAFCLSNSVLPLLSPSCCQVKIPVGSRVLMDLYN